MICPKCKRKMKVSRRTHHKQRKWVCRRCGKVKMTRCSSKRYNSQSGDDYGKARM